MDESILSEQHKEIDNLMSELKDRDTELNDMMDSHQKQKAVWEKDRKKATKLESENNKLQGWLVHTTRITGGSYFRFSPFSLLFA